MGPLKTLYENYKHELTILNWARMAKAVIAMRKIEFIYKNIGHAAYPHWVAVSCP